MREIELLAPARGYDWVRAAIDHGADAIYIGGSRFGARAAACNSLEDISRSVEYAHQYGVRLYATLNTLIYEAELREAEAEARSLVAAGVDALIVQDMAFARMGLGVELHSSTQMCNNTPQGVRFLAEAGFSRVVLERNLSMEAIRDIAAVSSAELEVFIHGAICVGQSGRCYLSRSMTPSRSGNRGECSQPCRLSYDLCDGAGNQIIEGRHLLSVKDLNLTTHIGGLLDAGATSLKIEGRLKDLSYTKNIVAHYRRVVDRAIAERDGLVASSRGSSKIEFSPDPAKSFSRGETTYMMDGVSSGVASFDSPKALGEQVGEVVAVQGERIRARLTADINRGDGLCYMGREGLIGSYVNGIDGDEITLNRVGEIAHNTKLWRNYDSLFERSVERSRSRRTIAVRGAIRSTPEALEVEYSDGQGVAAQARVERRWEPSTNREKMEATITAQLSKSGDTIFDVEHIETSGWGGEFIPAGELSALRREALNMLRDRMIERAKGAPHKIFKESESALYPTTELGGEVGVTNSLAEAFYRQHGVKSIEKSWEMAEDLTGARVLVSSYCLRREIGECLREGTKLDGELYLERGEHRFRLEFDCERCEMSLIKIANKNIRDYDREY